MWLRMAADGVKGAEDARRALESLGKRPRTETDLTRWMETWMPKASMPDRNSATGVDEFQHMVEDWWRAIGVVPRYEYTQLLEKYEDLKGRLEEAEATVSRLRRLLAAKEVSEEATKALDSWDRMTRQALDAQSEFARTWMNGFRTRENGEPPAEDDGQKGGE